MTYRHALKSYTAFHFAETERLGRYPSAAELGRLTGDEPGYVRKRCAKEGLPLSEEDPYHGDGAEPVDAWFRSQGLA